MNTTFTYKAKMLSLVFYWWNSEQNINEFIKWLNPGKAIHPVEFHLNVITEQFLYQHLHKFRQTIITSLNCAWLSADWGKYLNFVIFNVVHMAWHWQYKYQQSKNYLIMLHAGLSWSFHNNTKRIESTYWREINNKFTVIINCFNSFIPVVRAINNAVET